jgi:hypothetical protein
MTQDVVLGFLTRQGGTTLEQVNEGHGFSRAVDTPKVDGL